MALREIRKDGDPILRKICKEVEQVDGRVKALLDDMAETMYAANGVGLAAPQIGIMKRIVVLDDGEGLIEMINPVIVSKSGKQVTQEGCLSIPKMFGDVERPAKIKVKALDRDGIERTYNANGFLAVIMCHEIDHLDGVLYKDKATNIEKVED